MAVRMPIDFAEAEEWAVPIIRKSRSAETIPPVIAEEFFEGTFFGGKRPHGDWTRIGDGRWFTW